MHVGMLALEGSPSGDANMVLINTLAQDEPPSVMGNVAHVEVVVHEEPPLLVKDHKEISSSTFLDAHGGKTFTPLYKQ